MLQRPVVTLIGRELTGDGRRWQPVKHQVQCKDYNKLMSQPPGQISVNIRGYRIMAWIEANGLILLQGSFVRRTLTPAHAAYDRLWGGFSSDDLLLLHFKFWFSH